MIDYPVTPGPGASPDPTATPDRPRGDSPASGASPAPVPPAPAAPAVPAPSASPFEPVAQPSPRPAGPAAVTGGGRRASSRATSILFGVAAVVAIGGIAFAVGRVTAPTATAATSQFGNGAFGAGGSREAGPNASSVPGRVRAGAFRGALPGIGGAAGLSIDGTVQSISGSTMTVKTANGETVTVDLGPGTTYHTATTASANSVTSGSRVRVQVQLNRAGFTAGGGTAGGGGTTGGTGSTQGPLASGATRRTLSASDVTVVNP